MFAMLRFALVLAFTTLSSTAFASSNSLFGDLFGDNPSSATVTTRGPATASGHLSITVDISTQSMVVEDENGPIYNFDVSTGRAGHATPTGSFHPIWMATMWHSSKYENAPMPWSIFFYGGYAIHGTTDIRHLGHLASHGCVRLDPANAKLLFDLVKQVGAENTKIVLLKS
jgi:lipoprotein-anchoring transpeptidase ErfK/SrfK